MATKRVTFNWSILDRQTLFDLLFNLYPEIVGQDLTINQFHRKLTKHITANLPVKVTKKTDFKVDYNHVYVGGTYYSDEDKVKRTSIEIILVYNPMYQSINYTQSRYKRFCSCFADTILHEIIHMRQFRRRNFKILPDYPSNAEKVDKRQEQSYLGCLDEIDAYSFNISCELLERFNFNKKKVINYINKKQSPKQGKRDTWKMYLRAFDHDHNHEVIKRVKRKIIRYLDNAEIGKPYKTKDWINR